MPKATQESAASGIRKAKEIFGLESLPEKIGFGDVPGAVMAAAWCLAGVKYLVLLPLQVLAGLAGRKKWEHK